MPIPPEPYLALAVVAIVIVLSFALFGRKKAGRRGSRGRVESDQLVEQLTRIADALEKLVPRLEAATLRVEEAPVAVPLEASSPRIEQPPAAVPVGAATPHIEQPPTSPQKTPDTSSPSESMEQPEQSRKHAGAHITLSMFGR